MKKTIIALGISSLVLSGVVMVPGITKAYQGDPAVKGPNYSTERHELMQKAFENNDYEAWKSLMAGKGRVTQIVNQENFAKFAQAQKMAKEGNLTEAQKIRQELGLGLKNGLGRGFGRSGCSNR